MFRRRLIVYKAFADRPRDWINVEGILLRQQGRLNLELVFSELTPLSEAKESPEILDKLRSLIDPDLVRAKKTQRDKDWPMIGRLLEAHYFENRERPSNAKIKFWLKELRTPDGSRLQSTNTCFDSATYVRHNVRHEERKRT